MRTDVVRLGRLSGERTGEMMHFLSSMRSDRCIADADILVDLAHVLMLEKQKIIDRDIAKQLCLNSLIRGSPMKCLMSGLKMSMPE
jgi:argininosuccinate lyase